MEQQKPEPIPDKIQKKSTFQSSRAYLRYAGMATQMGLLIGGFSYLGQFLDNYFLTKPALVVIGSLSGVSLSLYVFIKQAFDEK